MMPNKSEINLNYSYLQDESEVIASRTTKIFVDTAKKWSDFKQDAKLVMKTLESTIKITKN